MSKRGQLDDRFTLLQYNVNKSRKKVLIGLFQDPKIQEIDFLAIQEPWRNRTTNKGYNTQNTFYLIEEETLNTRVATYINKNIPVEDWSVVFKSEDLLTILVQLGPRKVYIHNIYLPPSEHSSLETPIVLRKLQTLLELEGDHITLGDFNLHHPLWNPRDNGHHILADTLLEILANKGLELLLPKGTITRDAQRGRHREQSTLDLIFSTNRAIKRCLIDWDLEQSSDHLPIRTEFRLPRTIGITSPRRNWKALDQEKFLNELDRYSRTLEALLPLTTEEEIDFYTDNLLKAIKGAIEASTPLKRESPFNKPFWTLECRLAVKEARYLRRLYTRDPTEDNWSSFTRQRNLKGKILSKAKQAYYRDTLKKASKGDFWKPYKRAKTYLKSSGNALPTLKGPNNQGSSPWTGSSLSGSSLGTTGAYIEATTIKEKADLLRDTAFASPLQANLSDIRPHRYLKPLETPVDLLDEEIQRIGLRTLQDSAPGPDGIPNRVLHLILRARIALLRPLYQSAWSLGYHPKEFHKAQTIFLQKPGKTDYSSPKAYRPIALLNTLGKLLESIVAHRLREISEENSLLPNSQHGARPNRSTSSALFILKERLKLIKEYNLIPSILALDVQKAFDNVSHERLIHNLRSKRVPTPIVRWVTSFLGSRSTTVQLGGYISEDKEIELGIPQGSPISPILYLFYNAPLLEALEETYLSIDPTGFVDDITLLTYSKSTERNVKVLEKAYKKCLE